MNWRKVLAGAATTVFAASILAGCGTTKKDPAPSTQQQTQTQTPKEKVTIEFWGWWSSATRKPTIDKIVNNFNEKYKDQGIEAKYTFVPFGDLDTKLMASIAAGNPPDVTAMTALQRVPFMAQKKLVMDLSQFGADSLKAEYPSQIWEGIQNQGKPYAIPWYGDTKWLYINNKHFKDAGLDPVKDAPKTWDDLWKLADKLDKKDGGKITRIGFYPLAGNFGVNGWVWNSGSDFFDDRGFPMINNEKNQATMTWLKKWTDRYGAEAIASFQAGAAGTGNTFATEKYSMLIETNSFENEVKKANPSFEWTIVPVPTPDGKQHNKSTYSGAFAVSVPMGSPHPKEGYEFAKYWATEGAMIWAVEQDGFLFWNKNSTLTGGRSAMIAEWMSKYTSTIPLPVLAPNYLDAVTVAKDDIMAGKKDVKKAMDDAQGAVVKMVQENSSK